MLGLKLNHVSKRGPCWYNNNQVQLLYKQVCGANTGSVVIDIMSVDASGHAVLNHHCLFMLLILLPFPCHCRCVCVCWIFIFCTISFLGNSTKSYSPLPFGSYWFCVVLGLETEVIPSTLFFIGRLRSQSKTRYPEIFLQFKVTAILNHLHLHPHIQNIRYCTSVRRPQGERMMKRNMATLFLHCWPFLRWKHSSLVTSLHIVPVMGNFAIFYVSPSKLLNKQWSSW